MLVKKTSFFHTKFSSDLDFMTSKGLKITPSNGNELEEYEKKHKREKEKIQ